MARLSSVAAAFLILTQVSWSTWLPPGFLQWFWQSSVTVGDWLYIDGGEVVTDVNGQSKTAVFTQTIAIPLSLSWTNSSVSAVVNTKPADYPFSRRSSLFYNPVDSTVYSWGGFTYNNIDGKCLWAFKPDGRGSATWKQVYSSDDNFWTRLTSTGGALSAQSSKSFFSLGGGIQVAGSNAVTTPGLAVFDFQGNKWANLSSAGYSDCGCGVLGSAQFIPPFGNDGLLITLGGLAPSNHLYVPGVDLNDMWNVTLYDVYNNRWYHQVATGDIPLGRESFCIVGIQEAGSNSYEIFLFGGATRTQQDNVISPDFSDVFILSLPAFQWFRVSNSTARQRSGHYCQVVGGRQMLVIGGGVLMPETWENGLGIYDMTALKWTSGYDASAKPYVRPELVRQYYSQNQGYPSLWNDPALGSIFKSPSVSSTPGSTATAPPSGPVHHPNSGAIAGGVIGGLVGLILVLVVCRHFLTQRPHSEPNVPIGDWQPHELPNVNISPLPLSHEMGIGEMIQELESPNRVIEVEARQL